MRRESNHPTIYPEQLEQVERDRHEKILALLGGKDRDFNVCWDAWEESGRHIPKDFPPMYINEATNKFEEKIFFDTAPTLVPAYREYLQRFIKDELNKIPEAKRKAKMPKLAVNFIKRLEFYRRLPPPETITIGGKSARNLESELGQARVYLPAEARFMMEHWEFVDNIEKKSGPIQLVNLKVGDLFNDGRKPRKRTFAKVYKEAAKLGLKECPAEVAAHLAISYANREPDQVPNEFKWRYIAMKQIPGSGGYPNIFFLTRGVENELGRVWNLSNCGAVDAEEWLQSAEVIFCLRRDLPALTTETGKEA